MGLPNSAQNHAGNNPWGEGAGNGTQSPYVVPKRQDLSELWSVIHNVSGRALDVRYSGKGLSSKIVISMPESIDSPGPFAPEKEPGSSSGASDTLIIGGCPKAYAADYPASDVKPGRSSSRPGILILDGHVRLFTTPETVQLAPTNTAKPSFNIPDPQQILGLSPSQDVNKLLVLAADPDNLSAAFYTFLTVTNLAALTDWKIGSHYLFPLGFITVEPDPDDDDLLVKSIAWTNNGWLLQGGSSSLDHPWKISTRVVDGSHKLSVNGGRVFAIHGWAPGYYPWNSDILVGSVTDVDIETLGGYVYLEVVIDYNTPPYSYTATIKTFLPAAAPAYNPGNVPTVTFTPKVYDSTGTKVGTAGGVVTYLFFIGYVTLPVEGSGTSIPTIYQHMLSSTVIVPAGVINTQYEFIGLKDTLAEGGASGTMQLAMVQATYIGGLKVTQTEPAYVTIYGYRLDCPT